MTRRERAGFGSRVAIATGALLGVLILASAATSGASSSGAAHAARRDTVTGIDALGDPIAAADQHAVEDASAYTARPSAPVPPLPVKSTAPSDIGSWAAPHTDATGVTGIHSVLLRTGKVLLWSPYAKHSAPASASQAPSYEIQTMAAVYDPVTNTSVRVDPPDDGDVFCGAATILGDGTVLVVGGQDPYHGWYGSRGSAMVLLFNPITQKWSQAKPMAAGRWYPTVTELADGSAVIVGGRDVNARGNNSIERVGPMPSVDPHVVGTMKLDYQQDLYPNQFLLPNGHVFTFAGSATNFLDPSTWRVDKGPVPLAPEFNYPNAVVLPITPGADIEMVVYGGKNKFAGTTTSISSKIDLSSPTPKFTALRPMPQPRTNTNSVLLPDGTILVVGGNQIDQFTNPYLQSLLYDPVHDTWTPMASQALRRGYHSTAILLPDGRVLSAGDNGPVVGGGGRNHEEIYSPPYLFRGDRPTIVSAPAAAKVGSTFAVVTAGEVANAVLISPAATTHATNMHQRMVRPVSVPAFGHGLVLTIPNDGSVPPGPYMLFALNANNIPSAAAWVMVS